MTVSVESCGAKMRAGDKPGGQRWLSQVWDESTGKREIAEHALRDVLGCFATGVVVATTRGDGDVPIGLTVSSFNSVSLNPPLVLWSLACSANSHAAFSASGAFAINILSRDQADVCLQFARPAADKFSGVPWRPGIDGVPVLTDAVATLECRIYRQYEGGDHTIFIGEVVNLWATEKAPLIYHRGKFTGLASKTAPTGLGCNA